MPRRSQGFVGAALLLFGATTVACSTATTQVTDVDRALQEKQEQVRSLEERVGELSENETTLKDTLVTAQALSEDLKKTAVKEAEVVLSEAEVRGEKILDEAQRRAARLSEDIREMKMLRSRLAGAIRGTIETHLELLEGLATEEDEKESLVEARFSNLPVPREDPPGSGEGGA